MMNYLGNFVNNYNETIYNYITAEKGYFIYMLGIAR